MDHLACTQILPTSLILLASYSCNDHSIVHALFCQDVQTEVVLMILLRLAEDVISMDSNLQSTRKKQITQELHTHMDGLFTFFIETLQKNTAKYRTLKVI